MKYDAKEFKRYPEIMSKEQMRIACHISKRTALYLLQFNLIPHTFTGKKTRCYAIKKSDVIAFMNDREVNPEKYIAPKNWYKYGGEIVRPYKIRIQPPCAKDEKKLRRYYESRLAALPDVMDVAAAVDFTGYNRRTVCQWIRVGKLKALSLLQKYMIPKCYLIDWLCSDDYNNTNRKSRRHIDMLWEAQTGDVLTGLVTLLNCSWSYAYVAEKIVERCPDALRDKRYGSWFAGYVSESYRRTNQMLIDRIDALSGFIDEKTAEHLCEIFEKCCLFDLRFWDMVYAMGGN